VSSLSLASLGYSYPFLMLFDSFALIGVPQPLFLLVISFCDFPKFFFRLKFPHFTCCLGCCFRVYGLSGAIDFGPPRSLLVLSVFRRFQFPVFLFLPCVNPHMFCPVNFLTVSYLFYISLTALQSTFLWRFSLLLSLLNLTAVFLHATFFW